MGIFFMTPRSGFVGTIIIAFNIVNEGHASHQVVYKQCKVGCSVFFSQCHLLVNYIACDLVDDTLSIKKI